MTKRDMKRRWYEDDINMKKDEPLHYCVLVQTSEALAWNNSTFFLSLFLFVLDDLISSIKSRKMVFLRFFDLQTQINIKSKERENKKLEKRAVYWFRKSANRFGLNFYSIWTRVYFSRMHKCQALSAYCSIEKNSVKWKMKYKCVSHF